MSLHASQENVGRRKNSPRRVIPRPPKQRSHAPTEVHLRKARHPKATERELRKSAFSTKKDSNVLAETAANSYTPGRPLHLASRIRPPRQTKAKAAVVVGALVLEEEEEEAVKDKKTSAAEFEGWCGTGKQQRRKFLFDFDKIREDLTKEEERAAKAKATVVACASVVVDSEKRVEFAPNTECTKSSLQSSRPVAPGKAEFEAL